MAGTYRDITSLKQTEEALRLSEERYRTVADFTYDWEYWTEPDGNLLYVSPSCERITDYSAQEFLDDPGLMERIVHPDDRTNVSNHFHNARKIDYERSYSLDFRIIRRDGQTRWISHACRPVHGNEGQPFGRRASNRDITDRKRAEEALKESEEWYRSIVEESFDGIFVQKGHKIVYANSVLYEMLGYSEGKLEGIDHWLICHPDYQQADSARRPWLAFEGRYSPTSSRSSCSERMAHTLTEK